jgi:hypothetical protein
VTSLESTFLFNIMKTQTDRTVIKLRISATPVLTTEHVSEELTLLNTVAHFPLYSSYVYMYQILCLKGLLYIRPQWYRVTLADTTVNNQWLRVALSSGRSWKCPVIESGSFRRTQLKMSSDWEWLFLADTTENVQWLRVALSSGHNWICAMIEFGSF